jgi:two-component system cell cycle sensor histidine kinase/response regulator CckA
MSLSLDLSPADLAGLSEEMPVGVLMHRDGLILSVNSALLRILGYSDEAELVGRPAVALVHPEDRAVVQERIQRSARGHLNVALEERLLRKDGSTAFVEVNGIPVSCDGAPAVLAIFKDLSVNRRMDKESRDNGARFRALFDSDIAAQVIVDDQGALLQCNDMAHRLLGLDPLALAGRSLAQVFAHARDFQAGWEGVRLRQGFHEDSHFLRQDGSPFAGTWICRPSILPGEHFVAIQDRTKQAQMEDSLRQAQKMEAIGQLAGGVAHDFNNILMVIMMSCQLMQEMKGAKDSELGIYLKEVLDAAESAAALTRQLLTFSRRHEPERIDFDLNRQVLVTQKMLQRLLRENIELGVSLEGPAWVRADPGQIEQILLNLGVNARDAMPEGGALNVLTAVKDLGPGLEAELLGLAPGRYVKLTVQDGGVGMSPAVLGRIFEPFFTTKSLGQGTGMGLATVYGIVKQNNGSIHVESQMGLGSRFDIYLPQVAPAPTRAAGLGQGLLKGSECILLVEDEAALRRTLKSALQSQGYGVLEAANAESALELASQWTQAPAALISDLVLPGMDGLKLAALMREKHGVRRALFMSGYAYPVLSPQAVGFSKENVFQKPMRLEKLLHRLRDLLDQP